MKKILAWVMTLALLVCAAPALAADWQLDTAEQLADRLALLVDNPTFIGLYMDIRQEGVDEELQMMSDAAHADTQQVIRLRYVPKKLDEYIANYFMTDAVDDDAAALKQEILSRMNGKLPNMLNGLSGGDLWLALNAALCVTQTFETPKGFEQGALVLMRTDDVAVMVTFTQTGEDTCTAEACFILTDALTYDATTEMLNLLWERE